MGRLALYAVILTLALFVLTSVFVLDTGGSPSSAVAQVSVHDLSTAPLAHAQERVVTTGTLRFSRQEGQFLVTADGLGVAVVGYEEETLRRLVGKTVRVSGRFGFDAVTGSYIEAKTVSSIQ